MAVVMLTSCKKEEENNPPQNTPSEVRYDPNIKAVINSNCISCHGASNPNAGLSLTTYEQVRNATEIGNLLTRINSSSNPMPPTGLMSQTNREVFDNWVSDGYLE
jgi:mono/diheme cytochrome c family protein